MRPLTQEEFETKFYRLYKDKFKVTGKYINAITPVEIQCLKCDYVFSQTPNHYDKGHTTCPCCNKNGNTNLVIIGINDMWTTRPDIAEFLVNPEDGYNYRFSTDKKLDFVCPICKRIQNVLPKKFSGGFSCAYCSDKNSYPNRLMSNLLDLLNIDFKSEFIIDGYRYRYDFKFTFKGINYLLEMDGGYGHGYNPCTSLSIEEQKKIDHIKDELAEQFHYKLIRINCNYPSAKKKEKYIFNNILNSELNNIFSISEELLKNASKLSEQSRLSKFVKLWNDGVQSYDRLMEIFHVSRSTIRDYAKTCIDLDLLNLSYEEFLKIIRLSSNKKLAETKGHKVICDQTGDIFYSIAEAERQMHISNLSIHLSGKKQYCGTLPDGTKLTWHKINCAA